MPPAEPRPARRLRCESCLEVLSTRHPWDRATCRCGRLTASGPPWRPAVCWLGGPGAGWSDVSDLEPGIEEAGPVEPTEDARPRLVPLGYGGRLVPAPVASSPAGA